MSRSRRPQCSCGRGCGVCGDAGAVRRAAEAEVVAVDRKLGELDPVAVSSGTPSGAYEDYAEGYDYCGARCCVSDDIGELVDAALRAPESRPLTASVAEHVLDDVGLVVRLAG